MNFIPCKSSEATHVRIIDERDEMCEMLPVTRDKIYKIYENDEKGFEGEEMILSDDGKTYYCSFSLYIKVEWLKEKR